MVAFNTARRNTISIWRNDHSLSQAPILAGSSTASGVVCPTGTYQTMITLCIDHTHCAAFSVEDDLDRTPQPFPHAGPFAIGLGGGLFRLGQLGTFLGFGTAPAFLGLGGARVVDTGIAAHPADEHHPLVQAAEQFLASV